MPSSQKIIVVGHLSGDPELEYTKNDTAIAKFSIPVQEYQDKKYDRTNWFRCIAIGKRAEIIKQYLQKGDIVQVDLKKQDSSWEGQDGKRRYKTEFFVNDIVFLRVAVWEEDDSGKSTTGEQGDPEADDDIPF